MPATDRRLLAFLAACLLTLAAAPAARADVGTPGALYTGASAPTADKPQSKLWYHDGSWWGVMYDRSRAGFTIHERRNGAWQSTGVEVDARDRSWADADWDGNHLNIVSAGAIVTDPGMAIRFSRFAYDSSTRRYTRDIDPIALTSYGVEEAVVDRDATGKVWVTFTHDSTVMVTHTTSSDSAWTTPAPLGTTAPVVTTAGKKPKPPKQPSGPVKVTPDDVSSVVSYADRIGVFWGNQNDGTYYLASHKNTDSDDHWEFSKALSGPELSDDHLNVKALANDRAGQIFAAVKTSLNAPSDPMIVLTVLGRDNHWKSYTVWKIGEGHNTRPQVVIDQVHRELYVFSTSPCCNGGTIYMKKTSLDAIAFAPGPGTPVLQSSTDTHINNVSSTKQTVNGTTGLALIAGDDATRRYWHTLLPIDTTGPVPPDTEITSGPSGSTTATTAEFSFISSQTAAGFECSLDGGGFTACSPPATYADLAPGDHSFEVRAVDGAGNADPTPARRAWTVSAGGSLFLDGFESGDFSQWNAVRTAVDGVAAVQGAVVHSGSYAAQLSSTTTTGSFSYVRRELLGAPTTLTVGGSFRIDGEGGAGGNVPLLRLFDPAGARVLTLYRPNGYVRLWVGDGAGNTATTGRLATAAWTRIEVDVVTAGAGASTIVVRQDGVEVFRSTTASLGAGGIGRVQIGNDTKQQPFLLYADNVELR